MQLLILQIRLEIQVRNFSQQTTAIFGIKKNYNPITKIYMVFYSPVKKGL